MAGFTVTSTNGLGTTFTVGDLGTAFQIAGGSGQDTLIAQGFTLTADQRNAIFATSSIETIIDQSGTYASTTAFSGHCGPDHWQRHDCGSVFRLDGLCDGGDAERG